MRTVLREMDGFQLVREDNGENPGEESFYEVRDHGYLRRRYPYKYTEDRTSACALALTNYLNCIGEFDHSYESALIRIDDLDWAVTEYKSILEGIIQKAKRDGEISFEDIKDFLSDEDLKEFGCTTPRYHVNTYELEATLDRHINVAIPEGTPDEEIENKLRDFVCDELDPCEWNLNYDRIDICVVEESQTLYDEDDARDVSDIFMEEP